MPYQNEHSCRLRAPGRYKKFRRQNDKFAKGIDVIFGITENGTAELQAIRFNAAVYTAEEARKWLKDHKYHCIEWSVAAKAKETGWYENKENNDFMA